MCESYNLKELNLENNLKINQLVSLGLSFYLINKSRFFINFEINLRKKKEERER